MLRHFASVSVPVESMTAAPGLNVDQIVRLYWEADRSSVRERYERLFGTGAPDERRERAAGAIEVSKRLEEGGLRLRNIPAPLTRPPRKSGGRERRLSARSASEDQRFPNLACASGSRRDAKLIYQPH